MDMPTYGIVILSAIFAWSVGVFQTLGLLYLIQRYRLMGPEPLKLTGRGKPYQDDITASGASESAISSDDGSVRYLTARHEHEILEGARFEKPVLDDGMDT